MTADHTNLDMTMMHAMHDALRRELVRIARITARVDDDPQYVLRTAAGWEMFKRYLHVHHTAEDDAIWPVMRLTLADRPDDLVVVEAMAEEHAAIDPLLSSIDGALADRSDGTAELSGLTDALATTLTGHLKHEEDQTLALIDTTLTPEQWQHFSELHRARIGSDSTRYLPWLLDSATPESTAAVLSKFPEPLKRAYADEWVPAYKAVELWGDGPQPG
jgi:iron-sulfur cluster repair protein YtfE (RIC family)